MPKNPSNPLSSTSSPLVHTTQRCSQRYTGALLCIPAVFSDFRGLFKCINNAAGTSLYFKKKPTEYIK